MTDENTISAFGQRLKTTRESLRLSEKDVAASLHLNPSIIYTLESGNLDNALPTTFARGYMRSYARLLGISDQEANEAIGQVDLSQQTHINTNQLLTTEKVYASERYVQWSTYLIVSMLLVLVGVWWSSHSRNSLTEKLIQPMAQQPVANPIPNSETHPTANPINQTTNPIVPTTINPIATTPPVNPMANPISHPVPVPVVNQPHSATATPSPPSIPTHTAPPDSSSNVPMTTTNVTTVTPGMPNNSAVNEQPAPPVMLPSTLDNPVVNSVDATNAQSQTTVAKSEDRPKVRKKSANRSGMALVLPEPGLE